MYIGKDILDKYKTLDKVYVLKVCKSKQKQQEKDRKLLQYFTYGKLMNEVHEELDELGSKKRIRVRQKKNKDKVRAFIGRNERRGSKNFNTVDSKHINDIVNKRKKSSVDSHDSYLRIKDSDLQSHGRGYKDHDSSDLTSELSKDLSKHEDEVFKNNNTEMKNEEKENDVVQEVDSENNCSDIYKSNKRILRK